MSRERTNGHALSCDCAACTTIFVHGPYPPWTDKVMTPEEAMRAFRASRLRVPPLEPTPAREFLRELDALTGEPERPAPLVLVEKKVEKLLEKLGFMNPTGHTLGCRCETCKKARAEALEQMRVRAANGEAPQTLGELLAPLGRKRQEH